MKSLILLFLVLAPVGSTARAEPLRCAEFLQRARETLLGIPTPIPASVRVSSPLLELIRDQSTLDPEVIRLFVRHLDGDPVTPFYIDNVVDSLQEAFAPWFERAVDQNYSEMVKMQHTLLTRGLRGDRPYRSTSESEPLSDRSIGKFRHERISLFKNPTLAFDLYEFAVFRKPSGALKTFLSEKPGFQNATVFLPGIPSHHLPVASLKQGRWFEMAYPRGHSTLHYVNELESLMEQVRATPESAPEYRWLPLLADAIQVVSVGLPFERVNFSLIMAQVNYVLLKRGYRGIEHGELDLISALVPNEVFRKVFEETVRAAQRP